MKQRYESVNGEVLPGILSLPVEHVLQRYRDVWVPISTYPYLAIDTERVDAHCKNISEFAVFAGGRLMQNLRPEEGSSRLISGIMGGGVDAGLSPESKVIVEGMANPRAHWLMNFNETLAIGMHPFAALRTHYIYVDRNGSYQRSFAELVIVDRHSRPSSTLVDFAPLAEMVMTLHLEYVNGPHDRARDIVRLAALLDAIFVENEKILAAATAHHRALAPLEKSFDYVAPTLTRYGRLTHDAGGEPRIELSFALLHYEKALREFDALKAAAAKKDTEAAFFHGIYCVVAVAACAEAIGNRLAFLETGAHPDHRDKRQPLKKINHGGAALALAACRTFVPLTPGQPMYDALDRVRELRNAFMHAKERDEKVDPVALTSTVFTAVDENCCRGYLRNLRFAVAHVFDQLAPEHSAPIVTRENVDWLGGIEVP
ncbi:hypothetical protein [Stenotrophomonas sp. SAU14A_NAIMI4_8]|uniref:hypothetical protein n=1 Tax=Stenotrophomonas sp. SAU14A_NAIMI4_8 TaxID=2072409 RepID=UPI00131F095B|nr:hypothetical protein [Stenotrophomonas sp. SAU14A_NAIMI4_8]